LVFSEKMTLLIRSTFLPLIKTLDMEISDGGMEPLSSFLSYEGIILEELNLSLKENFERKIITSNSQEFFERQRLFLSY